MTEATAAAADDAVKFAQLSATNKLAFIGKVALFVVTFGFAFPTIFSD